MLAKNNDGKVFQIVHFLGADYGSNFRAVCVDLSTGKFLGVPALNLTVMSQNETLEYYQGVNNEHTASTPQPEQTIRGGNDGDVAVGTSSDNTIAGSADAGISGESQEGEASGNITEEQ